MNNINTMKVLQFWDKKGRYVFTKHELSKLFPDIHPKTFSERLNRLVKSGLLKRACKSIYVNEHAVSFDSFVIERIAKAMRSGHYNYISLESALSEYGAISQIPIDRLTVMTTGRKGIIKTPFGIIEFTHTKRTTTDILHNTLRDNRRPLRIATKLAAWRDLKRVGRNTELVDIQEMNDE